MTLRKPDAMITVLSALLAVTLCGACGSDGGNGETCSPDRPTFCNGVCVDTMTNASHCGGCDQACGAGRVCVAGECQCAGGETLCGGDCVDTDTDADNCGECGTACPAGSSCVGGACGCPGGGVSCGGECVDTETDAEHCGGCNNACPTGASCVGGECQCSGGMVICRGDCVDTQTDADHCGGCNNECPEGSLCRDGDCTEPCTPAEETCDGIDNDCDEDIDENLTRSCRNPCGEGEEVCTEGEWGDCSAPEPVTEVCDAVDNDCDGQVDEDVKSTFYRDADGDGYGWREDTVEACTAPAGYVANDQDCNDGTADISPADAESCDGIDNNCDGGIDEGCACVVGTTRQCGEGGDTGDCDWGTQTCISVGVEPEWGACAGGRRPTAETCNGTDENCNGLIDDGMAEDSYEVDDTCAQARVLPRADEGTGLHTVADATLYSTDGSDDTDWYAIDAVEASHLDCIFNPLANQCYFWLDVRLTPPSGTDHTRWSFCVFTGDCGAFVDTFCTDATYWTGSAYVMSMYWSGICGLDDGWTFYLQVDGADGEEMCLPYTLDYEFYFDGEITTEDCTPP